MRARSCLVLILLLCPIIALPVLAQSKQPTVQWASKLVNYSTQYDDEEFAARFVLGQPNVLPLGGDKAGAWAVGWALDDNDKKLELDDEQYIWVEYARPQKVQQIAIAENNGPGAVSKVYLYDGEGEEYLVFEQVPQNAKLAPRVFNVMIERTTYDVVGVKVVIEPDLVDGWNEIDAIGIADHKDPITWKINLAKDLKWTAKPENLGPNVNSSATELMDAIAPDGKTIYYSRHNYAGNIGGSEGSSDAYYSVLQPDGTWSVGRPVEGMINNTGNNYVNSITPDGNVLCVGNVYKSDGSSAGKSGVSFSYRTPNGWGVPVEAEIDDFYVNGTTSNYYQSNDGKVLLMSLNRNDTYGDNDLYVSFLKGDGTWTAPLNLGADVNTMMAESGPTLAADGKTLYFSSTGRSGYGSADLYLTRRLDDTWTKWSEPENLGDGINSAQSDQFYYIAAAGDYAYFSSKAAGGHGGADVYRIMLPEAVKPKVVLMVSGRTFDANSKAPIEAVIKYEILPEGKDAGVARSSKGKGEYKIVLPTGSNYGFRAEAKGYYPASDNLDLASLATYTELTKDLYLSPIEVGQVIRLNNIFFETAKSELKPESYPELDRAVTFLNDNAELQIAIGGHTDNVGNDAANQVLSTSRAKSVMEYLLSKGITASRMTSRGYGETKPTATNDTDEGRQLNRRVEFTIVN
jgi:OOP family OmpA-OmpF porin